MAKTKPKRATTKAVKGAKARVAPPTSQLPSCDDIRDRTVVFSTIAEAARSLCAPAKYRLLLTAELDSCNIDDVDMIVDDLRNFADVEIAGIELRLEPSGYVHQPF